MHLPSTSGALVVVVEVVVSVTGGPSVVGPVFVKTSDKVIAATMSRTVITPIPIIHRSLVRKYWSLGVMAEP